MKYLRTRFSKFTIVFLSCIFIAGNLFSQTNDECLACHEDNTLTKVRYGKTVSLYVNSALIGASVHKNLKCASCHKGAAVKEFPHPETLTPVVCGDCHAAFQKLVDNDVHHKIKNLDKEKAPTCKICHGTHQVKKPSSLTDKATEICGKCHKVNKLSAPYHTVSLVNDNCVRCHKKKDYATMLTKSVHSKLSCSNCHGYVVNNISTHKTKPAGVSLTDCYLCHSAVAMDHKESIHGLSIAEGIFEAAQCWDCHGTHDILRVANDSSKVSAKNLGNTCSKCHDSPAFAQKYSSTVKQPGKMYAQSVHGKLVAAGSKKAPTCVTCHGNHDIKNRIQPESQISSIDIPTTCAKCHEKITADYKKSIHWIAVKKGVREAPSCNDCHSEHSITAINTVNKRDAIKKLQETTCLECHQNLLLSQRYGIAGQSASSYQDSYHGLAVKRGDEKSAMCIDCHGVHDILPKYHLESTINPKNVTATCKKCHTDATEVFSKSYSHTSAGDASASNIENLVGLIYFWLIVLVVGFMIVHNLIIFVYELRERYAKSKSEIRIPRFTTNELIQHVILLVSFIILAITGFQLKYPDSWWGQGLQYIGFTETVRQNVHRGSAVVMIALSLYHVIYLIITSRGRDVLKGLMPGISDIKQALNTMMFYLRLTKKHPEYDNYNYAEKIEYWALIWGTIVMGLTGFVLWFPTIVGDWAPVWTIKVSEIIHFYEAILASLAILIWHWFFVAFRPKEYPVSFIVADGQMTVKHYKEEHRLRFRKVIIEWLEFKAGKRTEKKLNHFTKLFIAAIEKAGVNADEFIKAEIEKDEELKAQAKELNLI